MESEQDDRTGTALEVRLVWDFQDLGLAWDLRSLGLTWDCRELAEARLLRMFQDNEFGTALWLERMRRIVATVTGVVESLRALGGFTR